MIAQQYSIQLIMSIVLLDPFAKYTFLFTLDIIPQQCKNLQPTIGPCIMAVVCSQNISEWKIEQYYNTLLPVLSLLPVQHKKAAISL